MANIKKAKSKEELDQLYSEFWDIYDDNIIKFGDTMKYRLSVRHYKNSALKKLIKIIQWFNQVFDVSMYHMQISYQRTTCWISICDENDNIYATCKYDKCGLKCSTFDTEVYIEKLKRKGVYCKKRCSFINTNIINAVL